MKIEYRHSKLRQYVTLDVPIGEQRFVRMYYTAQNVAGSSTHDTWIRWRFISMLERNKSFSYLSDKFEHRKELEVESHGTRSILMRYLRSTLAATGHSARPKHM